MHRGRANTVERSIRPIALNRTNVLFAGYGGADRHLQAPWRRPQAYLTDIITKIVNAHHNSMIGELLPWAYGNVPAPKDVA